MFSVRQLATAFAEAVVNPLTATLFPNNKTHYSEHLARRMAWRPDRWRIALLLHGWQIQLGNPVRDVLDPNGHLRGYAA